MFKRLKEVYKLLNSQNANELADNIEANCPEIVVENVVERLLKLSWFIIWLDWLKTADMNNDLRDENGKLYSSGALHMSETIKLGSDTIEINVGAKIELKPSLLVSALTESNDPVEIAFRSLTINYIAHVDSGIAIAKDYEIDSDFVLCGNIQSTTIEYERLLSLYNGINRKKRASNIVDDYTSRLDLHDYSDDIQVAVGLGIINNCLIFNSTSYDPHELKFEYEIVPDEYDELKKVHPSIINDAKVRNMISNGYDEVNISRAINHSKLLGK